MRLGERLGLDATELATLYDVEHPHLRRLPGLRQRGGAAVRRRHRLPGRRRRGRPGRLPGDGVHAAPGRSADLGVQPGPPGRGAHGDRGPRGGRADGEPLLGGRRAGRPARARAPTCGPASSRPTPGGTARACPATCRATSCRSRRGSRTSPRRARCSTARPGSTPRSTWSARAAAPTSTPRSPRLVSTDPEALFDGHRPRTPSTRSSTAEPVERRRLTDDELDHALDAIGDFCDLRCPYFAGHARGTAELVRGGRRADAACLPPRPRLACRAALVHDVGRFGVPATVWDKPGPLTASERETDAPARLLRRADLQPARTAAARSACWRRRTTSGWTAPATTAASAARCCRPPARLLAAADAYHAMRNRVPYRGRR